MGAGSGGAVEQDAKVIAGNRMANMAEVILIDLEYGQKCAARLVPNFYVPN